MTKISTKSKTDFFRLIDMSAIALIITFSGWSFWEHLQWLLAVTVLSLIAWMIVMVRAVHRVWTNKLDEFAAYCWNRAASATIMAMILYFVLIKFCLGLILVAANMNNKALAISAALDDNFFLFSFVAFYGAFYWTRFRGAMS